MSTIVLGPCPLCHGDKLNLFSHWTSVSGQSTEIPKVQCTKCHCEASVEAWAARKPAPAPAAWLLIEALRAPEGHAVTLVCDNPDFNMRPDAVVEVCGDFTNWDDRRFEGENVTSALLAAYHAFLVKTGDTIAPEIAAALKRESVNG